MKRSVIAIALALLCWLGITLSSPAQNTTRLESRVDRLESELGRVRSQLTQLEAQVSGRAQQPSLPPSSDALLPNELSLEEQFDNLATLAIELKQDVRQLQARVAELEAVIAHP